MAERGQDRLGKWEGEGEGEGGGNILECVVCILYEVYYMGTIGIDVTIVGRVVMTAAKRKDLGGMSVVAGYECVTRSKRRSRWRVELLHLSRC